MEKEFSVFQKSSENLVSNSEAILDEKVLGQGGEALVFKTYGFTKKNSCEKKSGPFVFKDYSIQKHWGQEISDDGSLLNEFLYDRKIGIPESNKITLDYYKIFNRLKEINKEQKLISDRFNLPKTIRLAKNNETNQLGLLISDLTHDDKFYLIELKSLNIYGLADELKISKENTRQIIKKIAMTVKKDLDLAEEYKIKLGGPNFIYCCDVWVIGIKKTILLK